MTLQEIRQRLNRIAGEALRGDHEAAHGEEDRLFHDVLLAVATGKAGATEARTALESGKLEFARVRA